MVTAPRVSIVYLTKNGGQLFKKSIEAVFSQTVDFEFEVIAVDSGSTDTTLETLKEYPVRVCHIDPVSFNFGITRDYSFSLANGNILVSLSQDAIPATSTWLQNLIAPFSDDSVAVVQGTEMPPDDNKFFFWDRLRLFYYTRECREWMKKYNNIGVSFTSCAIRRRIWEESPIGPADMSEDKVFQKKVVEKGHKIITAKDAIDYHAHMYDIKGLAKRCENEGLGWRIAGQRYSFPDLLLDILNPLILAVFVYGLMTLQIRHLSELLFPLIRPIFVFKGNHLTKHYVT